MCCLAAHVHILLCKHAFPSSSQTTRSFTKLFLFKVNRWEIKSSSTGSVASLIPCCTGEELVSVVRREKCIPVVYRACWPMSLVVRVQCAAFWKHSIGVYIVVGNSPVNQVSSRPDAKQDSLRNEGDTVPGM